MPFAPPGIIDSILGIVPPTPPNCVGKETDAEVETEPPLSPGISVHNIVLTLDKPVAIIPAAPAKPKIPPCASALFAPT